MTIRNFRVRIKAPTTATYPYILSESWVPLPPDITALPVAPAPTADATYGEIITPTALLRPYNERLIVDAVVKVGFKEQRLEYALTLPDVTDTFRVRAIGKPTQHVGTFSSSLVSKATAALISRTVFQATTMATRPTATLVDSYLTYGFAPRVQFATSISYGIPNTLLLHFDGTNGSTTFTDSSSNAWSMTANGNAQLTTTSPKFGSAQLTLDGTSGTYANTPADSAFAIGTGDFTIDFWANPTTTSGSNHRGLFTFGSSGGGSGLCMSIRSGNWRIGNAGSPGVIMYTATAGTRVHIALVRTGTSIKFFVDGLEQAASGNQTWSTDFTDNQLKIGWAVTTADTFDGTIDEFRFVKGYAAWTGTSFTPPTAAY
jgi:hypothetical protein